MLVIIFNFILGVIYLMLTKFADVCAWAYPCVRICDCDCVCIGVSGKRYEKPLGTAIRNAQVELKT